MPAIHVCSLSRLPFVMTSARASHLVTLMSAGNLVTRPAGIPADRHLHIPINDIIEPMDGMTPPSEVHVRDLIAFAEGWERTQPMIIHCWAGISRSTAAAFIALCALKPDVPEDEAAQMLRRLSPTATPNARLVDIADTMLGRDGRMRSAVAGIGRGALAPEGEPFVLEVGQRAT